MLKDPGSQLFNNMSLTNSAIELNNLLQIPSSIQNKILNHSSIANESKQQISISQIFTNETKNQKPKTQNTTQIKGKFILAKRLSEAVLQNSTNQGPSMQFLEKQQEQKIVLNPVKGNNISVPQIQQKGIKNISSISNRGKYINEEVERIKKNNIFNVKENQLNSQYMEYNTGPRFRDGKIVSYTVVGSPQLYTKYHNNQEGVRNSLKDQQVVVMRQPRRKNTFQNKTEGSKNTSSFARQNSNQNLNTIGNYANNNNPNQTLTENFSDTRSNFNYQHKSSFKRQQTHLMNTTGMQNMNKKKYRNTDFDEVSKEDLIEEMRSTKQRILEQEEIQRKKEDSMNIEQRHLLNRERRILEKYNKTVQKWANQLSGLASQSKRKPEESLMLKSDEYRKKIEIINAFDSLRSDEKRFGQRIWYMMLRKNNIKSDNRLINPNELLKNAENDQDVYLSASNIRKFVNQKQIKSLVTLKDPQIFDSREQTQSDIFSNFMTVTVNNPYKPIEVIRKQVGERRSLNLTSNQFNSTQQSHFMNTQSYLQGKIQENMHLLRNRIVLPTDSDLNELIVEGRNLYDLEVDSLRNDGNPKNFRYEKLNFLKAAAHQNSSHPYINHTIIQKPSDFNNGNKESNQQSVHELDEEKVYEKMYDQGELSKTGRHFFRDL